MNLWDCLKKLLWNSNNQLVSSLRGKVFFKVFLRLVLEEKRSVVNKIMKLLLHIISCFNIKEDILFGLFWYKKKNLWFSLVLVFLFERILPSEILKFLFPHLILWNVLYRLKMILSYSKAVILSIPIMIVICGFITIKFKD